MTGKDGTFDFTDGGRAYTCRVETMGRARSEAWWWFAVSGDDARYAPFRADADDTPDTVRSRVLAYYEDRIARRGVPWRDRGDDAPAPAARAGAPPASAASPAGG